MVNPNPSKACPKGEFGLRASDEKTAMYWSTLLVPQLKTAMVE